MRGERIPLPPTFCVFELSAHFHVLQCFQDFRAGQYSACCAVVAHTGRPYSLVHLQAIKSILLLPLLPHYFQQKNTTSLSKENGDESMQQCC
jgi:hypothetical protein